MVGGEKRRERGFERMTEADKLKKAIRYLADSDACTRVQFRRDIEQCTRHAVDGCEACWREELGREIADN